MRLCITDIIVCSLLFSSTFSLALKKKKYKATTAILGDRMISLCDDIYKLTLETPKDEGGNLVQDSEAFNSCIRQFVKLIYADDYFDRDIDKVLAMGPQPKFLEIDLDEERVDKAKKNFGWTDRDIEDWKFLRLCTYQHWNHILTYKNHYKGFHSYLSENSELIADLTKKIEALGDGLYKTMTELPIGQGAQFMSDISQFNQYLRQLIELVQKDKDSTKSALNILITKGHPKFLDTPFNNAEKKRVLDNFNWTISDLEKFYLVRTTSYTYWTDLLLLKNDYFMITREEEDDL